ncbi:MAG: hypothetical protein AAGB12_15680, partial [Pseudomonadota bacterium]
KFSNLNKIFYMQFKNTLNEYIDTCCGDEETFLESCNITDNHFIETYHKIITRYFYLIDDIKDDTVKKVK